MRSASLVSRDKEQLEKKSPFSIPKGHTWARTFCRETARFYCFCVLYCKNRVNDKAFLPSTSMRERKGRVYYGRRKGKEGRGDEAVGTLNKALTTCRRGCGCSRADPLSGQVLRGRSMIPTQVSHHSENEAGKRRTSLSQRYF